MPFGTDTRTDFSAVLPPLTVKVSFGLPLVRPANDSLEISEAMCLRFFFLFTGGLITVNENATLPPLA